MKSKRIVATFVISLCLILSGCNIGKQSINSEKESSAHVHTFSNEWSKDETYHWHAATCEHTSEVKDKSEHIFGSWIIDQQATEDSEGLRHKICNICNYRVEEIIQKTDHTHNWETPTYTWNYDNSTCTAKRTCSINRYHFEEETVNSTYSVITQPTTDSYGVGRYYAEFINPAFDRQQKDVIIPKIDVPVTGVSLDTNSLEISVGGYSILLPLVSPYNATNKSVEWETSNDKVATISSSGLVMGIGNGTATITVTTVDGGFTATCEVTVTYIPVDGVSLTSTSMTLEVDEVSETIYASVSPSTATNSDVTWTIDDNSVASIETTFMGGCKVTAIALGTAIVTATTNDGGFTATCTITIIEKKNFSYRVGDTVIDIYQYSDENRAKIHTPITNNGNVNIYISSCSLDIEDQNGNLKQSVEYLSCRPDIIRPGETIYVYDDVSYTGDTTTDLVGIPHLTIKDASSANGTRYNVTNITFSANSFYGFKAEGTVTNNSDSSVSLIVVAVLIFDKSGKYYTTLHTYVYDELEPMASSDFGAYDSDMTYRRADFSIDDIGSYQAFAYKQEYIF